MFWLKKKSEPRPEKEDFQLYQWVVGKDFFTTSLDPWERTHKLLTEVQKRSLAEQVFVLETDIRSNQLQALSKIPVHENALLSKKAFLSILRKALEEQRILFLQDLLEDELISGPLQNADIETLLVSPLHIHGHSIQALVIANYSAIKDETLFQDFVSFTSSVLVLSLQNVQLYHELKSKNNELKQWSEHVEDRIEAGTRRLLEKEHQYYSLFEGSNDGIIVHDREGNILEVNGSACRLLGYERDELLGRQWKHLGEIDHLAEQLQYFGKALGKEKQIPLETVLQRKAGNTFPAELSSRRVRFTSAEAVQTFIRDISIRQSLVDSLRESKKKYQDLVESSMMGVFIVHDGAIQFVNQMFENMTGYTKEELYQRNFYDLIAPENRSMVKLRETQREAGEDIPEQYEVQFMRKGKGKWWGEMRARHVVLEGKSVVLGNIVDITQRKQLEIQLFENQKMESIGTLAGGIAHDFNNLLGGILGYASLLLSEIPKDHQYHDDIYTIAETAKRAADLTNRLLAFARGGKYRVTMIQPNKILQDIVDILSHTFKRDMAIETNLSQKLWNIKGDSQQIHQALLNVCMNAGEAMNGGGRLTISSSNQQITDENLATRLGLDVGEYVCVTVHDTGTGMDEQTKARVFEPFFTTKPSREGGGLGLAVVYGTVKNHDGSIIIESALGQGTQVQIYLPRSDQDTVKAAPKKKDKEDNYKTVLLADDESVIRQVGQRMLEKGGYRVILANNGHEAVTLFQKNKDRIDVVVLDLIMPEMGGKEAFRRLKEIDPDIKVIFTSGYGPYEELGIQQLKEGYFLQKPFQTEVLIQTVREVMAAD